MQLHEIINPEPKLIEKVENGKLVARLQDGSIPAAVYRVMSVNEYQIGSQNGVFAPRRGERIHAAIKPLLQFAEPGNQNALVQIIFDDNDGWQPKWMGDQVVVVTHSPITADKVHLVATGTRDDLSR